MQVRFEWQVRVRLSARVLFVHRGWVTRASGASASANLVVLKCLFRLPVSKLTYLVSPFFLVRIYLAEARAMFRSSFWLGRGEEVEEREHQCQGDFRRVLIDLIDD